MWSVEKVEQDRLMIVVCQVGKSHTARWPIIFKAYCFLFLRVVLFGVFFLSETIRVLVLPAPQIGAHFWKASLRFPAEFLKFRIEMRKIFTFLIQLFNDSRKGCWNRPFHMFYIFCHYRRIALLLEVLGLQLQVKYVDERLKKTLKISQT